MPRFVTVFVAALMVWAATARAQPISIVVAENFYADVARQIAGPKAEISAILTNPDQDPHLFEATASVARAVAGARVVVLNGVGYDPWMERLIVAQPEGNRVVIDVGRLIHAAPGANPHLWYDPATMPAYARVLAGDLARIDAAQSTEYAANLRTFLAALASLDQRIVTMRRHWSGTAVAATEPVFGYMAAAIGLTMREQRFQLAVMNGTEPSARDTAAFERDLRTHQVRVLIYNSQATDAAVERLRRLAVQAGVPTIGVTETEPPGETYQHWMLTQLDALDAALAR